MISTTVIENGIAKIEISTPGPVNTLSKIFNEAFLAEVKKLTADEEVVGILITSGKDDFAVGGDLNELYAAETPAAVADIIDPFSKGLRLLETGGKPVAVALNGSALGGGCEIALAAHRRFAADNKHTRFGLPETTLGLMPGAGGTQRLPRMLGIGPAAELILQGKTLDVSQALEAGLVDEVVQPSVLIQAATEWLLTKPEPVQPWDVRGFKAPGFDPNDKKGRIWFAGAWANGRARFGNSDAAGIAVLSSLHHGMERRFDAALAVERRHFLVLASGDAAKNKIRTRFFGPKALKPASADLTDVQTLGVVGGGVMGCGIAFTAARAGFDVVLIDIDESRAEASYERIASIGARQAKRGRMSQPAVDQLLAKVTAGADYDLLKEADFVIEAVFEQADVKDTVLKKIEAATRAAVPIASNTSTLPIERLAKSLQDESRILGMHFFAPVEKMKLLEIIHTPATSQQAKTMAEGIGAALRKSVVTVNDGLGFYTSRIVSSLTGETVALLTEGVPPQLIDNVMKRGGFALGPASLVDLTTIPLLRDIMTSMCGDGMQRSLEGVPIVETLNRLAEAGRSGKKSGSGLYDYTSSGAVPWPGLVEMFGCNSEIVAEDVANRLWCTQSLEAVRALEEEVVTTPLAADAAAHMGWGYPAHMGGPFAYIETIGIGPFIEICDDLTSRFGERFTVPDTLREMAANGQKFHEV